MQSIFGQEHNTYPVDYTTSKHSYIVISDINEQLNTKSKNLDGRCIK
jgi:hypothetical protein